MYDTFRSIDAAKEQYRRTRSPQMFILNGNDNPNCAHCGRPIFDYSGTRADGEERHPSGYRNNRCTYFRGSVIAMHYTCSWEHGLTEILRRPAA